MTGLVKVNRILIAAPKSGSGKTMITCGLLNLLKKSGRDVTSFKCGPDYIDPMFHKKVLGIYGGNLDTFFLGREKIRRILPGCGHKDAVMEGVMGLYDGVGGLSLNGSCYEVASFTGTPIVLVVDGKGTGRTLLSTIKGILSDDTDHLIKGVILNRVSASFYERLRAVLEEGLMEAGFDVKLLGFIPELKDVAFGSRHLGLMMPGEIESVREKIDVVSKNIEEYCDVDALISIMESAEALEEGQDEAVSMPGQQDNDRARLAVAMDDAFCFYYRENLELLKRSGVELCFFSPLQDKAIPDGIDGIYLGGGYPELHLKELSENESMRDSIKEAIESGMPVIAECGGFMYLHSTIAGEDGREYEMAGVLDGSCSKKEHLVRFGYVELENAGGSANSSFAASLNGMRGHEFHYFDSTVNGSDMLIRKPGTDLSWSGMHIGKGQVFGFPHMYFESDPEFVKEFVKVMRDGRG